MIKVPTKAIYALAKAMHHANATNFYLDLLVTESGAGQNAKKFLKQLAAKASSIILDIRLRIGSDEMKAVIESEMQDPLSLDSLTDAFIELSISNRELAEIYISELLKTQPK